MYTCPKDQLVPSGHTVRGHVTYPVWSWVGLSIPIKGTKVLDYFCHMWASWDESSSVCLRISYTVVGWLAGWLDFLLMHGFDCRTHSISKGKEWPACQV